MRERDPVRWMIRRDMPEVMRIERASFEHRWTEDDFLRCLRQRNIIGMVCERGDAIVGFMLFELGEISLTVLNFAVDPEYRRRGIGRQMVERLKRKCREHNRRWLTTRVRETNLAGQLFWRRQGLRAVEIVPNYYENGHVVEDAIVLESEVPCDGPPRLANRVSHVWERP